MRKVLFIIQSYPSNRSANVLCDDKIMRAMLERGGYDIHCLVYRFHGQKLYEEISGLKVHRFNRGGWWNLYTFARDNEEKWFYKFIVKLNRLYMRLWQVLCIPIYPNYEPFLAKHFAKEAIKLHNEEQFDLVVAEHNGRDTLYAGSHLKKYDERVKLVSILWDPFSGKELAKYLPHAYAYRMLLRDESKILRYPDRIICLLSNKTYQETYSKDKPFFEKIRFLDIPGIIRSEALSEEEKFTKKGRINLLYSGILTLPDRDPTKLIEMIKRSRYADNIHLMFFVAGIDGIAKAKKLLKDFRGSFIIHSYVPNSLLKSIAAHSEVLINIGGGNARMVPSKIFEYMSSGKPILSTYYVDNDSSVKYLENYRAATCIDVRNPLSNCVIAFENFIDQKLQYRVLFSEVETQFPLNTPNKYIEVFEELFD